MLHAGGEVDGEVAMDEGGGAAVIDSDESPLSGTGTHGATSAASLIDAEARRDALRDAADAAAALQAALRVEPPLPNPLPNPYEQQAQQALSEGSMAPPSTTPRRIPPKKKDKAASPEKRMKLAGAGLNPPPLFGGSTSIHPTNPPNPSAPTSLAPTPGASPALVAAPGTAPTSVLAPSECPPGLPQANHAGPQYYQLDPTPAPAWVQELRDLFRGGQKEMLSEIRSQGKNVAKVSEQVNSLQQRQTTFQSRLDQMELEMRDLRSARSVSPGPSRKHGGGTGGYMGDVSPRSNVPSSVSRPVIDDFQLVIGGWNEAKKSDIESEVRQIFSKIQASPLLHDVHIPFIRSNFARIELLYADTQGLGERRKVQSLTLEGIKKYLATEPFSKLPQQAQSRLWVARNRSKEDRAKIRALVGIKEYCSKYISQDFIDLDWRGKLWIRGEQVLYFAANRKPYDHSLMLNDAKGDESGWWVDLRVLARVLARNQDDITRELTE